MSGGLPSGYIDLWRAAERLRPHLFGDDAGGPLSRMVERLAAGPPPGVTRSGLISYISDFDLFCNADASRHRWAAQERAYLVEIQNEECVAWLRARDLVFTLTDGTEAVDENRLLESLGLPGNRAVIAEKSALENQMTRWLEKLMRDSPHSPISKTGVRKKAQEEKIALNISGRSFNRAWAAAVKASGAIAWSSAGKRNHRT